MNEFASFLEGPFHALEDKSELLDRCSGLAERGAVGDRDRTALRQAHQRER
jgi:hypothetical protein